MTESEKQNTKNCDKMMKLKTNKMLTIGLKKLKINGINTKMRRKKHMRSYNRGTELKTNKTFIK